MNNRKKCKERLEKLADDIQQYNSVRMKEIKAKKKRLNKLQRNKPQKFLSISVQFHLHLLNSCTLLY